MDFNIFENFTNRPGGQLDAVDILEEIWGDSSSEMEEEHLPCLTPICVTIQMAGTLLNDASLADGELYLPMTQHVLRGHYSLGTDDVFESYGPTSFEVCSQPPHIVVSDPDGMWHTDVSYFPYNLPNGQRFYAPRVGTFYADRVVKAWNDVPLARRFGHKLFKKLMPAFHSEGSSSLSIKLEFDQLLSILSDESSIKMKLFTYSAWGSHGFMVTDSSEKFRIMVAWYFSGVDISYYFTARPLKSARPTGLPAGAKKLAGRVKPKERILKCKVCNEMSYVGKACSNPLCSRNKKEVRKCAFCEVPMRLSVETDGRCTMYCDNEDCKVPSYCTVHKTQRLNYFRGAWSCYLCDKGVPSERNVKNETPLPDHFMEAFTESDAVAAKEEEVQIGGEPEPVVVEEIVISPFVFQDIEYATSPAPELPPPVPLLPRLRRVVAGVAVPDLPEGKPKFSPPCASKSIPPEPHVPPPLSELKKKKVELKKKRNIEPKPVRFCPVEVPVYKTEVGSHLLLRFFCFVFLATLCIPIMIMMSNVFYVCGIVAVAAAKYCYSLVFCRSSRTVSDYFAIKLIINVAGPYLTGLLFDMVMGETIVNVAGVVFSVSMMVMLCLLAKVCFLVEKTEKRLIFKTFSYLKPYNHQSLKDGRVDAVKIGDHENDADLHFWTLHKYTVSGDSMPRVFVTFCWLMTTTMSRCSSLAKYWYQYSLFFGSKCYMLIINEHGDVDRIPVDIRPREADNLVFTDNKTKWNENIVKCLKYFGVSVAFDHTGFNFTPTISWTSENIVMSHELFFQLTSIDKITEVSDLSVAREIMTRSASRNTRINLDKRLTMTTGRSVSNDTLILSLAWAEQWKLLHTDSLFR